MTITRTVSVGSGFLLVLLCLFVPSARAQQPSPAPCCLSALKVTAQPSVELLVTAPNGLQTGFDPLTGQHVRQISSSSYLVAPLPDVSGAGGSPPETRKVAISMPVAGLYTVQAIGQGPGRFTIEFAGIDSQGAATVRQFSGTAGRGATFVYYVRYSPTPGSKIAVTPLVPLQNLSARLDVAAGPPPSFQVKAQVTLGSASAGFDPLTEPLSLHLAGISATVPPGSFHQDKQGIYRFVGTIEGIPLRVSIVPQVNRSFGFQFDAQNIDLTAAINPLRLLLVLGHNAGATLVNAVTK